MKKALFISAIILLCVAGGIYYHFFFDTRIFLKSDTESIVNHLSHIGIGESSTCPKNARRPTASM